MENEQWAEIRKLISGIRGVPEIVVDHVSVFPVLRLCVSGISNMKIAYFSDLDEYVVERILFQSLGFTGWQLDLDLNPWQIYQTTQGNYELYEMKILSLTSLINCDIIRLSYKLCKSYEMIREEIKQYD